MRELVTLASTTIAEDMTLVVPLGLLLLTMGWLLWLLRGHGSGHRPPRERAPRDR